MHPVVLLRAEEQEDNADDINGNFVRDVLNGPTLTKTRSGQHSALQGLLLVLVECNIAGPMPGR